MANEIHKDTNIRTGCQGLTADRRAREGVSFGHCSFRNASLNIDIDRQFLTYGICIFNNICAGAQSAAADAPTIVDSTISPRALTDLNN